MRSALLPWMLLLAGCELDLRIVDDDDTADTDAAEPGVCWRTDEPDGAREVEAYDDQGHLVRLAAYDPSGAPVDHDGGHHESLYRYDDGQLQRIDRLDTSGDLVGQTAYTWEDGRVVRREDRRGIGTTGEDTWTTTWSFQDGRIVEYVDYWRDEVYTEVRWTYDESGRLVRYAGNFAQTSGVRLDWAYDDEGRLVSEDYDQDGIALTRREWAYGEGGRVERYVHVTGLRGEEPLVRTTEYVYEGGRVVGTREQACTPQSGWCEAPPTSTHWSYDTQGRLVRQERRLLDGTLRLVREYEYDEAGRLIRDAVVSHTEAVGDSEHTWTYDDGRLVRYVRSGTRGLEWPESWYETDLVETWIYDEAGNLVGFQQGESEWRWDADGNLLLQLRRDLQEWSYEGDCRCELADTLLVASYLPGVPAKPCASDEPEAPVDPSLGEPGLETFPPYPDLPGPGRMTHRI